MSWRLPWYKINQSENFTRCDFKKKSTAQRYFLNSKPKQDLDDSLKMDNIAENMIQPPPEGGDQTFSKIVATHRSPPPPVPQKPLKKCSSRSRSSSSAESLSTITSPATPQLHLISAPSQDNFPPNSGPNLHQESLPKEVMSLLGIAEITSQGVKTVSEIAPVIDHNPDKVKVGPNLDQNPNLDSLDLNNLAKEGDPINHGQDPKPVPAQTAPDSHPPVSSGTCTSTSCPFQSFHNKNVNISEFLAFGQTPSEPSLTTRPTLKKVDDTIHFLVENIKDGTGIWPSVFLEKLIRLIVSHCSLTNCHLFLEQCSNCAWNLDKLSFVRSGNFPRCRCFHCLLWGWLLRSVQIGGCLQHWEEVWLGVAILLSFLQCHVQGGCATRGNF